MYILAPHWNRWDLSSTYSYRYPYVRLDAGTPSTSGHPGTYGLQVRTDRQAWDCSCLANKLKCTEMRKLQTCNQREEDDDNNGDDDEYSEYEYSRIYISMTV